MQCSKCRYNNEPRVLFCIQCGQKMELDFADVRDVYVTDIRRDREDHTALNVRHALLTSIFFLMCCIVFKGCVASNPPVPECAPLYQGKLDETQSAKPMNATDLTLPLAIPTEDPVPVQ